jgi:hypothetical protein
MILSSPRRVFRQTVFLRLVLGFVSLLFAGMFFYAGLEIGDGDDSSMVAGVLVLAAYAGLAVAIGRTTLTVFREGVRRSSVLGTREMLWEDIAEYRYRLVPIQGSALIGGLSGLAIRAAVEAKQLTLVGRASRTITVTSSFANADQAVGMILRELHGRLKPGIKRRLANGDEVAFGLLKLSLRGVAWKGKEPIPLREIAKVEISMRKLRVRRKGKMLDSLGVATEAVPNVLLALELIEELRVNAGVSGAAPFA